MMMKLSVLIALFLTSTTLAQTPTSAPMSNEFFVEGCDAASYYAGLPAPSQWTFGLISNHTIANHVRELTIINGTEGGDDVYLALIDLDAGSTPNTVKLVYADKDTPSLPAGNPNTWREHGLWPARRGADAFSGAFFDIHMKRPADSTALLRKSSLFFGTCGTVTDDSACFTPATSETAADTQTDGKIWAPPVTARGKVARALFYGALRYEQDGLRLTDCPPFSSKDFGYRSQLIRWHLDDPVSDEERQRNLRACERWQGNRNPFVDEPDLVVQLFGQPDTLIPGGFVYSKCTEATQAPTATPNACSDMDPGDTPLFLVNSDNPDNLVIYPLSDISEDVGSIFVTDNPWDGTELLDNEGTLEFVLPEGGIKAGRSFGYGKGLPFNEQWNKTGNFDLNIEGDNIFVYCVDADDKVRFLWGYNYNAEDWAEPGGTAETYGVRQSALPTELELRSVALEHADNCLYTGPQAGFKVDLLAGFLTTENYDCRDQFRFAPQLPGAAFNVKTMVTLGASAMVAWALSF